MAENDDVRQLLHEVREENAAAHRETRLHFDTTAEALRHDIQLTAEGLDELRQEMTRKVADLTKEMRSGFAETQAMFKFSHAELHHRVSVLEEGQRTLKETVADLQSRMSRLETGTH